MNMIELQLGLAPPFTSRSSESPLDLSIHSFDFLETKMKSKKAIDSLEFSDGDDEGYGSSLSTQNSHGTADDDDHGDEDSNFIKKKRNFDQAFHSDHHDARPQTLPLLVWNKQPDDDDDRPKINYFAPNNKITENDVDGVVGWPPINSYRRKFCHQDSFPAPANYVDNTGGGSGRGGGRASRSIFVKVQMEGVMITRKIDLSRHQSFQTLTSCLSAMFGTGLDGYTLTYLDKDGDWLLAGDGPWREFVQSVRRLRLLRRTG